MRVDVLGVGFDNITMTEAVAYGKQLLDANKKTGAYVVTPNPEIVWLCRDDVQLKETIDKAALVLPDGIGVIYGSRILGRSLKERVAGADFADLIFAEMAKKGQRLYLLGAKPGVAETAAETISKKHPGIVICGTADGYFKTDEPIIEKINAAEPDFLLVCLGAPKQEKWMRANRDKLNVSLMAGLGGVLDVYAGNVQRAPEKWQKMNLEWLYRLLKEPRRIGRMMKLPLFIFAVIGQRIRGK